MAMIPPMIPPAMNVVVLETGSGADACVSCVVAVECFSVLACVAVTSGDLKVSGIVDVVDVMLSCVVVTAGDPEILGTVVFSVLAYVVVVAVG